MRIPSSTARVGIPIARWSRTSVTDHVVQRPDEPAHADFAKVRRGRAGFDEGDSIVNVDDGAVEFEIQIVEERFDEAFNSPWRLDGWKLEGRRTGYELAYQEFFRLVSDPYSQPVIAPPLKDRYRYAIAGEGSTTMVLSEHDIVVGLRGLHNQIQDDPQKQDTIYQRAMDLWR